MEFIREKIGPTACYATRADAAKRNLLVLHGALGSSERILHLAPGFADFNLLFCDLKGHGHSDTTAAGYEPAVLAGDLVAAVSRIFGHAPFAVIAESFSGIVALELSRLLPQLQCLVMVDTRFDNQRMPDSLAALVRAYESRVDQREAIAGVSAGFFGLDFMYCGAGDAIASKHCPAPMTPHHLVVESYEDGDRPTGADAPWWRRATHLDERSSTLLRDWIQSYTLGFDAALRLAASVFRPSLAPVTALPLSTVSGGAMRRSSSSSAWRIARWAWASRSTSFLKVRSALTARQ